MAKQVPARNGGTLTRPDKGETMNPNGRPKKLPNLDKLLADILGDEEKGEVVAKQVLIELKKKALKGDLKAIEMFLDRAYGKPKQFVETKEIPVDPLQTIDVDRVEKLRKMIRPNANTDKPDTLPGDAQ